MLMPKNWFQKQSPYLIDGSGNFYLQPGDGTVRRPDNVFEFTESAGYRRRG